MRLSHRPGWPPAGRPAEWRDDQTRGEGADPGDRRRGGHRHSPLARRGRRGFRYRSWFYLVLATRRGLEGGEQASAGGRRRVLRLPRPRPVRRAVHHGGPGGQGPGRGGAVRKGTGLPAGGGGGGAPWG